MRMNPRRLAWHGFVFIAALSALARPFTLSAQRLADVHVLARPDAAPLADTVPRVDTAGRPNTIIRQPPSLQQRRTPYVLVGISAGIVAGMAWSVYTAGHGPGGYVTFPIVAIVGVPGGALIGGLTGYLVSLAAAGPDQSDAHE
jgi:hypothetical protein